MKLDPKIKIFLITFFLFEFGQTLIDLYLFGNTNLSFWHYILVPTFMGITMVSLGGIIGDRLEKKYGFIEGGNKLPFKLILCLTFILFIIFHLISGFYIIETSHAVVLTKITGTKQIIEYDGKIHYRLRGFTNLEYYDLRNNYMIYPAGFETLDISLRKPTDIITADDKVVSIIAILYYSISDLNKWAVISKNTELQLYSMMESAIYTIIKKANSSDILKSKDELSSEIGKELKTMTDNLGIKITDFKLNKVTEPLDVLKAKESAEALRISSEAKIKEAENLQKALDIRRTSLKDMDPEILNYLAKLEMYKILPENSVIVIPQENAITIPIQNEIS